ncbi:MAG: GAF domain-containing protein, partial [SAR202 cluster bacterium]|nr:GAF domain-containing protein [SAR202 cluster bacterium]
MTTRRPSGGGISDLLRYPYIVGAVTFVFSLIPIALKSDAAVILFFLPILMSGGLAPTGRAIVVVVGLLVLLVTHIFAFGADLRTSLHFTEFAVPAVVIAASGAVAPIVYRLAMQLLEARAQAARDKPPKAPKAPKAPKPPKTQSPPPAVPQPVPQQAAPASPAPKQSGGSLFGRLKQAVPANMTRQEKAGAGSLVKDVSKAVKASSDIVALCKSVLDAVAKSIQFEKAIVSLIDASQGTFTDVYHAGIDVPGRKMGDASQLTGSFTETVANAKTPRLIQPATEQDMASVPASLMPSVTAGLFSFIAAPIVHEDTAIGILHLRSTTRSAYTEEHLALVARVAGLMAPRIVQFRVAADAALAQARAFVDPGAPPPAVPQALPPAAPAGTPAASTPQQDTRPRAAQPQAPDAAPGSEKASAGQVQVQEVLGQLVQAANSTKDIANVYDVLAD